MLIFFLKSFCVLKKMFCLIYMNIIVGFVIKYIVYLMLCNWIYMIIIKWINDVKLLNLKGIYFL